MLLSWSRQNPTYLSSVTRVQSLKGDAAEPQIRTLLRLYRRQPGQNSSLTSVISIPNNYEALCADLEQPNNNPSAHTLSAVPSSPPLMNAPTSFAMPSLTRPSTSTDVSSQPDDADDLLLRADIQLMEYAKEPSVEDLKNRPPLFGGEEVGPWRFASADGICRSKGFHDDHDVCLLLSIRLLFWYIHHTLHTSLYSYSYLAYLICHLIHCLWQLKTTLITWDIVQSEIWDTDETSLLSTSTNSISKKGIQECGCKSPPQALSECSPRPADLMLDSDENPSHSAEEDVERTRVVWLSRS